MSEPTEREVVLTTAELAASAGKVPPLDNDAVDQLRDQCRSFIDRLPGDPKSHQIGQARTKLDEMHFWLKAHMQAVQRG
jgi:hypothetical protein